MYILLHYYNCTIRVKLLHLIFSIKKKSHKLNYPEITYIYQSIRKSFLNFHRGVGSRQVHLDQLYVPGRHIQRRISRTQPQDKEDGRRGNQQSAIEGEWCQSHSHGCRYARFR